MTRFRFAQALVLGGSSIVAFAAANAQSPQQERAQATTLDPSGQRDSVEEGVIVVTAQNRSQNVQDVPIAISVVSGESLKEAGVTDFRSVERVAPSLQIISDTSQTRVSVRGVGTRSNAEAQDQSIAVNIDGEYINRPTILNAAIFDMDRIEVLRGPQGTLYGKNSTGGAVNFITRKPRNEYAMNFSATLGNYDSVLLEGGADIPLGDIGGVRFSGIYADRDGYFRHPNTPGQIGQFRPFAVARSGDNRTEGGRVSLRLEPLAGLTLEAAIEHVHQRFNPVANDFANLNVAGNQPGVGCAGGAGGFVEVGPNTPGTQCIPLNTNLLAGRNRAVFNSPGTGVSLFDQNTTAVRGRVIYDFGPVTFTYTGGYRDSKNDGGNTLPVNFVALNFGSTVKTHSHEARLNGSFAGKGQWQAGVFLFDEKIRNIGGLYFPAIGRYLNFNDLPTHSTSYSGFGQVEYPIIEDTLTAVGGLRYTKDERDAVFNQYGGFASPAPVAAVGPASDTTRFPGGRILNLSSSGKKVTWLAGLNYTPTTDILIYGKASTGYKPGGFDGTATLFRPETNTAYEGGLKWSFGADGRNLFNVAGFYYDYKDLQNDVLLNPAVGGQTFNAGKAIVKGIEAEVLIKPFSAGTLTASVNYLDAKFKDFTATYAVLTVPNTGSADRTALCTVVVTTGATPCTAANIDGPVDLGGNRLPLSPKWVIGLGYDHEFDLGDAGRITARVYTRYKSAQFFNIFNYNDARQKGYFQTEFSVDFEPSENVNIQAFVRNIENTRPLTQSEYVAAGPDDIFNWSYGAPRTYGIRFGMDF